MTTIAILHAIHATLGPEIPASVGLDNAVPITIAPARDAVGEAHDLDWDADARKQRDAVARLLAKHPGASIAYFGAAPVPHAMHLGAEVARVLGWTAVKVYQRHHGTGLWAWSSTELTPAAAPTTRGLPRDKVPGPGDVVVRISMRNQVDPAGTAELVPQATEIDLETTIGPDTLCSAADLDRVGDAFVDVMDTIARLRPRATVHLFASVPCGVAFTLGLRLSPTQHPPVYVYQYNRNRTPANERALLLNAPEPQRIELSADEQAAAPTLREQFAKALVQVQDVADVLKESKASSWWEDVTRSQARTPRLAKLDEARLTTCKSVVGARVDLTPAPADIDGFAYDAGARAWRFSDDLLTRFARRFPTPTSIEGAARLFFLHEGLHHDCHGLTGPTATAVGRFPKVVEELDYEADLWAVLHEYRWAQTYDRSSVSDIRAYFLALIERLVGSFWAFDDRGADLADMPVRRVNRYLIWYWQRIALEHVDTIDDVLAVLRDKPVIELTGPRVQIIAGRVSFLLGADEHEPPELGFISRRGKLARVATGPAADLHALVGGFRSRSDGAILTALRGARDLGERH